MAHAAKQMLAQSKQIARQDDEASFKDARSKKVMFELVRLKAWKFDASTEALNTEQRRLFEETMAEDEASLQVQLEELQAPRRAHGGDDASDAGAKRRFQMVRVSKDVSERFDIIPAEFFVHRHVCGKWAYRCCQCLVQAAVPQIIDGDIPAAGPLAHIVISRFVDHLPYYCQQGINARSGLHTPHSTLAHWAGRTGAALEPQWETHKRFELSSPVLRADATPVAMLDSSWS